MFGCGERISGCRKWRNPGENMCACGWSARVFVQYAVNTEQIHSIHISGQTRVYVSMANGFNYIYYGHGYTRSIREFQNSNWKSLRNEYSFNGEMSVVNIFFSSYAEI